MLEEDIDEAIANEKDNDGWTPLHYACSYSHLVTVDALVARGAIVNEKDDRGQTPLHYACLHSRMETALMLIREKADIFASDNRGRGCLDAYGTIQPLSAADTAQARDTMRREFYWTRRKSYAMFLSTIKTLTHAENPRDIAVKDEALNCQDIQQIIGSYL